MTESVWVRIARLRHRDPSLLAPPVMRAWDRGRIACDGLFVNVAAKDAPEDLVDLGRVVVVETLRVQALQDIYMSQGTTKAASILKSWHGYGLALDVIHKEFAWFTNRAAITRWPLRKDRDRAAMIWFKAVAGVLTQGQELAWGGLWKNFPDSPHFQSARTPRSPAASSSVVYTNAGGGAAGRLAVWKTFGLDT